MTGNRSGAKVAFLFDEEPEFPPDLNNMKCYYVSEELARRGFDVTWVSLSGTAPRRSGDISFVSLRVPALRVLSLLFASIGVLAYCLANSVRVVYIDGWFYARDSPLRQLATIAALRASGVCVVVDQRDPYLDFEVARGAVRPGSLRHSLLKVHESATLNACSLLVLPSKAYERLLTSEGAPAAKVKGIFRGIDLGKFNPMVDGSRIRSELGLEGKFVVGWFGVMYGFRQVKEVLVPLALSVERWVPNARMVIGGRGSLEGSVRNATKAEGGGRFDYVGAVEYSRLPEYLAACDVLVCPVSTRFRFTRHSNWLKIIEGLATGVPVIATRTEISELDFRGLKGIVWTGEGLGDFQSSIESTYQALEEAKSSARWQAGALTEFGIEKTIPVLVDQVVRAGKLRAEKTA